MCGSQCVDDARDLKIRQFARFLRVLKRPHAVAQSGIGTGRQHPRQMIVGGCVGGFQLQGASVVGDGRGFHALTVKDGGPQVVRGRVAGVRLDDCGEVAERGRQVVRVEVR